MTGYLRTPISNGNPHEQALVRRWWHHEEAARGQLVWEYYLEGRYVDAIWFPSYPAAGGSESDGKDAPARFPLKGAEVVVCEAKGTLTPELGGQALVNSEFARRAGAEVLKTIIFAE